MLVDLPLAGRFVRKGMLVHKSPQRVSANVYKLAHDVRQEWIAARGGELGVELQPQSYEPSHVLGLVNQSLLLLQQPGHSIQAFTVEALRGQRRDHRLDTESCFNQLVRQRVQSRARDTADPDRRPANESPVTMAHLDGTDDLQGKKGLSGGGPGDASLSRNLTVRRKPRPWGVFPS